MASSSQQPSPTALTQYFNSNVEVPKRYITKVMRNLPTGNDCQTLELTCHEPIGSLEEEHKPRPLPTVPRKKRVARVLSFSESPPKVNKGDGRTWMKFVLGLPKDLQRSALLKLLLDNGVDIIEASVSSDALLPLTEIGSLKSQCCMALRERGSPSGPLIVQTYHNSTGNNEVSGGTVTKDKKP